MGRITITACLLLLCAAPPVGAGVIHQRAGRPSIEAPIILMDNAGVTVRTPGGESRVIAWDLVRDVEPDGSNHLLAEMLAVAEDLWRARSRLQRNDVELAEPVFERLFERYRGGTSECALIVGEGLLRCRLARGANEAAVIPFLEVARLHRAGMETDRYVDLASVFDESWDLCPQLAPAWADTRVLEKLQRDLAGYDAQGDEVVAGLATAYRLAALTVVRGSSVLAEESWPEFPNHEGIDLLESLLGAIAPADDRRRASRNRLLRQSPQAPPWVEAWTRYQVGVSLLAGTDPELRRRGMVSLAHLPARFDTVNPYLAGLAAARLAEELAANGRTDEAAVIRAELERLFPRHPILFVNDDGAEASDPHKENA